MTALLAISFATGVLLLASCVLWPATMRGTRRSRESRIVRRLREHILRSGIPLLTPRVVVAVSILLALVVAGLVAALIPVAALVVAATLAALATPTIAIVVRGRARYRATRVVWPDVVDHLVSAARSGLPLPEGTVALARSGPPATRPAFQQFEHDYRTTGNFSDSLDLLKARLLDPVADRLIETLKMSREVGGTELPTILRGLALYLRQDAAIRSEIEARQSWTVNAARLGVVAPWVILFLLASRPEAALAYNTPGGTVLILIGAAVSVIAYRVMLVIGRLPEEPRWFR